jgi:small-conductance mechanosensitive channel
VTNNGDGRRLWWLGALVLALAFGLVVLLNPATGLVGRVPLAFQDLVRGGAVLLVGGIASLVLERRILRHAARWLEPHHAATLRFVARLVLYLAVLLALLAAFGVGVSSVVFGGAFLTVILGLAGQTMLGNLLAGVWLVTFHPFQVGDRVDLIAWQYPILVGSYPHEAQKPVHSGVITDISLMYTELAIEGGTPMLIPNGVLVTAAVINRSRAADRRTRVRFDVRHSVPADALLAALGARLAEASQGADWTVEFLGLADILADTYSVVVAVRHGGSEDAVRHAVLAHALAAVRSLTPAT